MTGILRVEEPGVFTTVQDLGRPGNRLAGVPPGGAMDRFALAAANLLVGNPEGAAALECALAGPTLTAVGSCLIAVTGADFEPAVNGRPVEPWTSVFLAEGDRLTFGERRWGARCYIALGGGFEADRWLGSASTYLLVGRGGIHGRPLKVGDELGAAGPPPRPAVAGRRMPETYRPPYGPLPALGAVPGPQARRLPPLARKTFYTATWTVSRDADRMGYRLEGELLEIKGGEMISFGLNYGCVQVPPSGQPILLMADHQTAGGYPVVAGVGRADLPLAAQLLPGEHLRFEQVEVEEAQGRWRRLQAGLQTLKS